MQIIQIAGNLGRDAEIKTTRDGDKFASFSVAVSTGWGERKGTTWWDVTRWGKGAEGLAGILRKGSKVAVSGEVSTREHEGRTYLQIRADHVTVQGGGQEHTRDRDFAGAGPDRRNAQQALQEQRSVPRDDLDDDVPF